MAQLPQVPEPPFTIWKSLLDPLLANSLNKVIFLTNVSLVTGTNVINHGLGRIQQGYFPVDQQASGSFYRSAPFNNLTLTLTASAPMTISLAVF